MKKITILFRDDSEKVYHDAVIMSASNDRMAIIRYGNNVTDYVPMMNVKVMTTEERDTHE